MVVCFQQQVKQCGVILKLESARSPGHKGLATRTMSKMKLCDEATSFGIVMVMSHET